MVTLMTTLLFGISLSLVHGECPAMEDIPIMRLPNDGLTGGGELEVPTTVKEPSFTCARIWTGKGHSDDLFACTGEY